MPVHVTLEKVYGNCFHYMNRDTDSKVFETGFGRAIASLIQHAKKFLCAKCDVKFPATAILPDSFN